MNAYFLLNSHSALGSALFEAENYLAKGDNIVFLCLKFQVYEFLSILNNDDNISVKFIDFDKINNLSSWNPINLIRKRFELEKYYKNIFRKIPINSEIYFFNVMFSNFFGYMLWKLRNRNTIFYIPMDPVELYRRDSSFPAILKYLVYKLVFPFPFIMVSRINAESKPYTCLPQNTIKKIIYQKKELIDIDDAKKGKLFQKLTFESGAKVLWLMGLVLDYDDVYESTYFENLRNCYEIVLKYISPSNHAIKFHPRSVKKEKIWSPSSKIIPFHIPSEFIKLPDIEIVFTISSTSASSITKNAVLIGIAEIIKFKNQKIKNGHLELFHHFSQEHESFLPKTFEDLNEILTTICDKLLIQKNLE